MKYIGFLVVVAIWLFANGFWEMSGAPEHLSSCQKIEWAQQANSGDFRPDEWLALRLLESIKC
ncbi:hypothetical protein QX220_21415 [Vibrio vulnificus]|uniref:hypothetical protein n=1 Tax=Vibrio TaxID=662 RepID=UPI001F23566F|nr:MULTISPECIES: hypothetical protein [Vibrio]MCF8781001.1 hypothetical protein [Vibrio floridensis]MDS1864188.1 hypothetical protein [Vibrio vulnificus]